MNHFFDFAGPAPEYLGLQTSDAETRAAAEGATLVRVADLDARRQAVLTFELRHDRLTLFVSDGVVVEAGFC